MTHTIETERTMRILQDSGYRLTGPRRAVVDAIQSTDRAFTADELLQRLNDTGSGVGRATVFRTLDLLVQHGILDRLHQPDGCHSYLMCGAADRHHHHLICSDCGAVVEFEDEVAAASLARCDRTSDVKSTEAVRRHSQATRAHDTHA